MDENTIKWLQIQLINDKKLTSPIVVKTSKFLKNQDEPYHEIQLIPNHLLSDSITKVLNEKNVSLYKLTKSGKHYKQLNKVDSEITYIFVVKRRMPNNILFSSNRFFSDF